MTSPLTAALLAVDASAWHLPQTGSGQLLVLADHTSSSSRHLGRAPSSPSSGRGAGGKHFPFEFKFSGNHVHAWQSFHSFSAARDTCSRHAHRAYPSPHPHTDQGVAAQHQQDSKCKEPVSLPALHHGSHFLFRFGCLFSRLSGAPFWSCGLDCYYPPSDMSPEYLITRGR